MKVRHRSRTALAAVATASLLGPLLPATAEPAAAAAKVPTVTGNAKTDGTRLNLRRTPSASAERFGSIADGAKVWIVCQVAAQQISGTVRTTNLWNQLANGAYVSDAYVVRPATPIPGCAVEPAPAPRIPAPLKGELWGVPVGAGLVSGFRTTARPSHDGVDLAAKRGTPILAASAGTVIRVVCNVSAGSCDVDGNRNLKGCGWYVEVQHAGNIVTRYCHLVRRPVVQVGQTVTRGQLLGHVGTSGSSSGPHLHFEVHVNAAPAIHANAVDPIAFLRTRGLKV
ncbi:peptidoglycan DD-metalloendopeptidase family protein [Actinoplanes aureus]|uniref:M23 family metallopeptidase n=1 Tax=Actinoplanes aureus TaxID=2792083 RepID=A0A931CGQ3_9ACTN|nr:peptidoglycan DD-metalloendopeptidase family protein [Actinoplanes aureus]MBG0566901.1 M23 family metallopeptidase [Actinoplanes aureus]